MQSQTVARQRFQREPQITHNHNDYHDDDDFEVVHNEIGADHLGFDVLRDNHNDDNGGGHDGDHVIADQPPVYYPPGLDYLAQVDQLIVCQQVEIMEVLTGIETQNKYKICNTLGQDIYFAAEKSEILARQCLRSSRGFTIHLYDNNQREIIRLKRPNRYCCTDWCQKLEVQSPPGTPIGYIDQDMYPFRTWFSLMNHNRETVLKIRGPLFACANRLWWDYDFTLMTSDCEREIGKISKKWSTLLKELFTKADNFCVQFPMDLDARMKAVVLAATFLIDFMYFEQEPCKMNHFRN